jgi:formate dehydrogenase major subunit
VLVTSRIPSLTLAGRRLHQVGLPYHWGGNGLSTGDSANDLVAISLDPNSHIQETKAFACDVLPGRRPAGAGRAVLVHQYQRRAGITEETGTEP